MVKQVVRYQDFNGNQCEETLYFNLSKVECTMMQLEMEGGLDNYIKEVIESGNNHALLQLFTKFLLNAYGVKSEDGKRFIKSEELTNAFRQSPAYEEMFMTLVSDPNKAENFFKNVMPPMEQSAQNGSVAPLR